jgi:hypothetical protein
MSSFLLTDNTGFIIVGIFILEKTFLVEKNSYFADKCKEQRPIRMLLAQVNLGLNHAHLSM